MRFVVRTKIIGGTAVRDAAISAHVVAQNRAREKKLPNQDDRNDQGEDQAKHKLVPT